jgi:hypothetical protein
MARTALVLEQAASGVDWNELGSSPVSERDEAHFLSAIHNLLKAPDHAAKT